MGRDASWALPLGLCLSASFGVLVFAKTEAGESPNGNVPHELRPYLPFQFSKVLSLQWWLQHLAAAYHEDPEHMVIEFICVMIIAYLLFRPTATKPETLTEREKDKLVDEWEPEPLVPENVRPRARTAPILVSATGPVITVEDDNKKQTRLLNFGSYNYLGLAHDARLKKVAKDTISKYSVGSCGPRGFYGTIDVHVDLEKKLKEHFGTESAIIYTDWIGCINSVIPAFAKKHDLLVCDEGIHFLIQQGIRLSRANVLYFKHNDMDDLRQVLESIQEKDEQMSHKKLNRRFIITEGISQSHGDICPLNEIVALAKDFKYRIILDDSQGVGALHPRGSVGYHNVKIEDVDILVGALDTAVGSTGAFVVGSEEICYHQSLSSTGYVFTASAPPFQCTCATAALDIMKEDASKPKLRRLHENSRDMRQQLDQVEGVFVGGSSANDSLWLDSPLIHIRLDAYKGDDAQDLIDSISQSLRKPSGRLNVGVFAPAQQYLEGLERRPEPSLKVCVTADHTKEQIKFAVQRIRDAVQEAVEAGPSLR